MPCTGTPCTGPCPWSEAVLIAVQPETSPGIICKNYTRGGHLNQRTWSSVAERAIPRNQTGFVAKIKMENEKRPLGLLKASQFVNPLSPKIFCINRTVRFPWSRAQDDNWWPRRLRMLSPIVGHCKCIGCVNFPAALILL